MDVEGPGILVLIFGVMWIFIADIAKRFPASGVLILEYLLVLALMEAFNVLQHKASIDSMVNGDGFETLFSGVVLEIILACMGSLRHN